MPPKMPDHSLLGQLAEHERRIVALERGTRLSQGYSIEGLPDGSGDQASLFHVDQSGWDRPGWPVPCVAAAHNPIVVTSGTFTTTFMCSQHITSGAVYRAKLIVTTDVGTTGEYRCSHGSGNTDVVTLPDGAQTDIVVSWLHGVPIGYGDLAIFHQVRRTSGAGNINVYAPYQSYLINVSAPEATAGGIVSP